MDLRVGSHTDRGQHRETNEDAVLADLPLVAVADGMGGHEAGEVASQLAIEKLQSWKERLTGLSGRDAAEQLREAFDEAHRTVSERGAAEEELRGMGTTLTAAWIDHDRVTVAHVGDSRAYLLRSGTLEQITEDQNVAQEWVRRGRLSPEEAATSRYRHMVLQAIGAEGASLDVATAVVGLEPGDRLVLMTDGVYGMVPDTARLRTILMENGEPDDACRALVEAANEAGGEDNISVVIVDVPGEPAAGGDGAGAPPIIVDRGESARQPEPHVASGRRRWPKPLIIGGAVVVLAVMVGALLFRSTGSAYVVSARSGNVVVLKGRQGNPDLDTAARGEVVRVFRDEKTKEFPTTVLRELRTGIVVDTLSQAEEVIEQLPRQLEAEETPTPKPKRRRDRSPSVEDTLPPATTAP